PSDEHLVQGQTAEIDESERRDDRDRDRDGDDHRRRAVAQEREQNDDREYAAPDRGIAHVVDRTLNERALIGDHLQLEIAAVLVDALHLGANGRGDRDGIRAGLLAHANADRRHAADLDIAADIAETEPNVGDVLDADRRPVDDGDDRLRDLVDRRELAERAHVEVLEPFADVAARHRDVLAAERGHDIPGRELHRREPVSMEVDVDLAIDPSPDVDRADAGYLLEALDQIVLEDPSQLLERKRRACAENEDGLLIRIELPDLGRIGLGRQGAPNPVE